MAKATPAEIETRVTAVYELLLNGVSRHAICQHAAKTWGISSRQTDRLIAQANKAFEEQAAFVRERELGKSINRLTALYMRTVAEKDYRGALAVQRELNTLLGLNAPAKHEHEIKDWRTDAIRAIQDGKLGYDDLLELFGDEALATSLLAEANTDI